MGPYTLKSLESKFRQTKRTHTFLEHITRTPTALEPDAKTPFGVKPRTPKREIPLDTPEPTPPRPPTEVLGDLREGWLASKETPTEPESEAPAQKSKKSPTKQKALANYTPFIESVKTSVRKKLSSATRRYEAQGEKETSSAKLALLMIAILVALFGVGALIYAVSVSSILDPAKLSSMEELDSSPTPAVGNAATAGQTTQSAAISTTAPDPANAAKPTLGIADPSNSTGASDANSGWYNQAAQNVDLSAASNGQHDRATPSRDDAIMLNPTLAQTASGLASKANDHQAATQPSATIKTPPTSAANVRQPNIQQPTSLPGPAANNKPYLDLVRAGQSLFDSNDLSSAYRAAAQARALNPTSLPALELMQVILAAGGNTREAQAAATEAIAHGGKAVFELQHVHASPLSLHPARIVITATTLEFIPEASCATGAFTIPLASITSVQMGQNSADQSSLYLLNIQFNAGRASGQLSFRDSSSHRNPNAAQISSQLSSAQETALFTAIRNVLLQGKGRA